MREAHSPRQMGWNTVVAVAGREAADTANAVAHCGRRSRKVQHAERSGLRRPSLPHQRQNAGNQAAVPGEPGAVEEHTCRIMHQGRRIFKDVPQLGANHAHNRDERDHADGVRLDLKTTEVEMKYVACAHRREPQHKTEGADRERAKMNIWIHAGFFMSIASSAAGQKAPPVGEDSRMATSAHHALSPVALPVLISRTAIAKRIAEIGAQIDRDLAGESVLLVGVLKGAAVFLSDLARAISIQCTFDFVAVSSYGKAARSSGAVKLIKDLDQPIEGRNIILVEDILDTGLDTFFLKRMLMQHRPRSLRVAALLDKPDRRIEAMQAEYVGFRFPITSSSATEWIMPSATAIFQTSASSRQMPPTDIAIATSPPRLRPYRWWPLTPK